MIDPTLQRGFLTLLAVVVACLVYKYLPGVPDWTLQALRDVAIGSAGVAIGKAHFSKPGEGKVDP